MRKIHYPVLAGESHAKAYLIAQEEVDHIAARAEQDYPREACGVILAKPDGEDRRLMIDAINVAHDPKMRFMFDAKTMKKISRLVLKGGYKVEAIWHSHTNGLLAMSPVDIYDAAPGGKPLYPGVVYLVLGSLWRSGEPWMALAGYLWEGGEFKQVKLDVLRHVAVAEEVAH